MGSTDGSIEIARKFVNVIQRIERVDVVEKAWNKAIKKAVNDWIILLDPDEIFPLDIFPELENLIKSNPDIGLISIPWKYYFVGTPLKSTHWGQDHFKARVFNRNYVEISGLIFDGIKLKPGYQEYKFPYSSGYVIRHYWIDSIPQLFSKHWRYIKHDGEARYKKGQRFNFKKQIKDSYKTLKKDLVDFDGLKDGLRGIFLSFFHAWFIWMCHLSLWYYQNFEAQKTKNE
jgi:glycosyltransferase involved in cell wall biosynthesis